MRSRDKLSVRPRPMYGKEWLYVEIKEGTQGYDDRAFVPSFEDHFRIICGYAYCELKKYPNIDPIPMLQRFFTDATDVAGRVSRREIDYETAWEQLRVKYKIPSRD